MLQLPTYLAIVSFPPSPAAPQPPLAQIRRCPDEIHQPSAVTVAPGRSVGGCPPPPTPPRRRGFAFLGLYRKHAHETCIKPGGRAGTDQARVESGVVSCPSCSTASVVARHARDSESTGQPCFTWRRFADSVPRRQLFLSFPSFCPPPPPLFFFRFLLPSRITPVVCGMSVGRARGDRPEFRRVFSGSRRKTGDQKVRACVRAFRGTA